MKVLIEEADLYHLLLCAVQPVEIYDEIALETHKDTITEILEANNISMKPLMEAFEINLSEQVKDCMREMYAPSWIPKVIEGSKNRQQ